MSRTTIPEVDLSHLIKRDYFRFLVPLIKYSHSVYLRNLCLPGPETSIRISLPNQRLCLLHPGNHEYILLNLLSSFEKPSNLSTVLGLGVKGLIYPATTSCTQKNSLDDIAVEQIRLLLDWRLWRHQTCSTGLRLAVKNILHLIYINL